MIVEYKCVELVPKNADDFFKKIIGEYVVYMYCDRFFWGKVDSLLNTKNLKVNDGDEYISGIRFFNFKLIKGKFLFYIWRMEKFLY
jgi:hypothetical protein